MPFRFAFIFLTLLFACKAAPPKPEPARVQESVPPPSTFSDWLKTQRELVEKEPQNTKEVRRLLAMLLADGQTAEAEKLASSLPNDPFAGAVRWMLPRKLRVAHAELCRKISGFRRYVPYGEPKFKPGAMVLVYVEFEGFELVPWGDYQTLHLRYEWELYDEQGRKLSLPAWEKAAPQEKEDKIEFRGAVADFHQSFGLPLPKNISGGSYTIRISVEDQANKKRDEVRLPIEIVFE